MKHWRQICAVCGLAAAGIIAFHAASLRRPGLHISSASLMVGEETRSFRVVVPDSLQSPAPVVIAFHGIGDSAESMAGYSQLDRLAADRGFLLVYPSGLNSRWTVSDFAGAALHDNRDVRFFDALLEEITSNYPIDHSRVYLTGMSNGATFAQHLANARSSVIAAVVAHSGPRPTAIVQPERRFPVLLIVGEGDFAAGTIASDLKYYHQAQHVAKLIAVEGHGHEWSTRHNGDAWSFLSSQRLP